MSKISKGHQGELAKFAVVGFKAGAAEAGIRYQGRLDVGMIYSELPAVVAATFTRNMVKAAPVIDSIELLSKARRGFHAVVVNSGNANACTGARGLSDCLMARKEAAGLLDISDDQVLTASTGVIGEPLPMERLLSGIKASAANLRGDGLEDVAEAILTTDTRAKIMMETASLPGGVARICGIAKGAGMIAPDMEGARLPHATMLAFILTDAAADPEFLQEALTGAVETSFNRITVDGDTSTNDTVLVMANGAAANAPLKAGSAGAEEFRSALSRVCSGLARMIVEDGEGATKCVEIKVTGAKSAASAEKVARTIANSPLVKTAIYGQDPNWGRIVAAAGRAGVEVDWKRMDLFFDEQQLVKKGDYLGKEAEAACGEVMKQRSFVIRLDLGMGDEGFSMLTCDLSVDYVHINADYRT